MNVISVRENNIFGNKVNSLICKHKFKFRKEMFKKIKDDFKKTWNLINSTHGTSLKNIEISHILFNEIIYENEDIARFS